MLGLAASFAGYRSGLLRLADMSDSKNGYEIGPLRHR